MANRVSNKRDPKLLASCCALLAFASSMLAFAEPNLRLAQDHQPPKMIEALAPEGARYGSYDYVYVYRTGSPWPYLYTYTFYDSTVDYDIFDGVPYWRASSYIREHSILKLDMWGLGINLALAIVFTFGFGTWVYQCVREQPQLFQLSMRSLIALAAAAATYVALLEDPTVLIPRGLLVGIMLPQVRILSIVGFWVVVVRFSSKHLSATGLRST